MRFRGPGGDRPGSRGSSAARVRAEPPGRGGAPAAGGRPDARGGPAPDSVSGGNATQGTEDVRPGSIAHRWRKLASDAGSPRGRPTGGGR